jgi:ribonuclease III
MVGNTTLSDMYAKFTFDAESLFTLARIHRSLKYKLPDRLRLHPAQAITLRASANIQGKLILNFRG